MLSSLGFRLSPMSSWQLKPRSFASGLREGRHLRISKLVQFAIFYSVSSSLNLISLWITAFECNFDEWMNVSEAFAVVREAAIRKLGMRHFDVQVSLSCFRLSVVLNNKRMESKMWKSTIRNLTILSLFCYSLAYVFITISIVIVHFLL